MERNVNMYEKPALNGSNDYVNSGHHIYDTPRDRKTPVQGSLTTVFGIG